MGDYIRQRRVEFACHRLTASGAPLSVIALDAGFADQSQFTNIFRQLVGMTPGNFRARFIPPSAAPRSKTFPAGTLLRSKTRVSAGG